MSKIQWTKTTAGLYAANVEGRTFEILKEQAGWFVYADQHYSRGLFVAGTLSQAKRFVELISTTHTIEEAKLTITNEHLAKLGLI